MDRCQTQLEKKSKNWGRNEVQKPVLCYSRAFLQSIAVCSLVWFCKKQVLKGLVLLSQFGASRSRHTPSGHPWVLALFFILSLCLRMFIFSTVLDTQMFFKSSLHAYLLLLSSRFMKLKFNDSSWIEEGNVQKIPAKGNKITTACK